MDETAVVRRAQAGDRSAFEELVRLHARLVWAVVHGMTRDPAWTEDLVQETFLRAWQSLGDLDDPAAFRAYLTSIARRLAWRHAEVSGRSTTMAQPPEPAPPARDRGLDPEEASEQVRTALARLPERYRVPVTLHFVDGMQYAAIARATGLENGSLRGLLARGLAKLRAELAPWWRTRHEHA